MQAAILVIGDEILAGRTQDTNSRYLARRLARLGIPLKEIRVVDDDAVKIQLAAWELSERRNADLVITSGGLGPTHDDRTVKAIAALHGVPLEHDPGTWQRMVERAARLHEEGKRGDPGPGEGAKKVALVPRGAQLLANPAGAAPGLLLERKRSVREGTTTTLVLPGVPEELRAIWTAHIEERLAKKTQDDGQRAVTRRWECHGRESELADSLEAVEREHPEVRVGSYPGWGTSRIVLSLTGKPQDLEAATAALAQKMEALGIKLTPVADDEDA